MLQHQVEDTYGLYRSALGMVVVEQHPATSIHRRHLVVRSFVDCLGLCPQIWLFPECSQLWRMKIAYGTQSTQEALWVLSIAAFMGHHMGNIVESCHLMVLPAASLRMADSIACVLPAIAECVHDGA